MPIPGSRVRTGGVYTTFTWDDGTGEKVIAFADEVRTSGVTPVADPAVIQPLDQKRPVEIITPGAHRNGVITLVLTELYNSSVWQRLGSLANSQNLVDIFRTVAALNNGIKITKYITPPVGLANNPNGAYHETFYDCVVARVTDDETINVTTMQINKEIEVWFTYSRKFWIPVSDQTIL